MKWRHCPARRASAPRWGAGAPALRGPAMPACSVRPRRRSTQKGAMDVRQSLLRAVQELISKVPGSSATWADGSGPMLVGTSKEAQAQVCECRSKENKWQRTMANVPFALSSVKTSDADEKGLDWSSVFQSL